MHCMNIWAVLVAAVSSFMLGGLWYSKLLFHDIWIRHAGIVEMKEGKHPARVFGASLIFSLIAAAAFACWLGPNPPLHMAVCRGLIAGAALVGSCFGINYQFASRSMVLWAVDAGYHTAQFAIFGLILGLWH
jgi:hypothetical protein